MICLRHKRASVIRVESSGVKANVAVAGDAVICPIDSDGGERERGGRERG